MSSKAPIILPDKYYLNYFHYLLDFVERNYQHVLDIPEYSFYQAFRNLTEDAQCLYIRLSNRRGDYFRTSKINYSEISDIEAAQNELVYEGFIQLNESEDLRQFQLFTKSELVGFFEFLDHKQKKNEMIEVLTEEDLFVIHQSEAITQVLKNEEVEFIKLLFFGDQYGQMTEFVIRDIGNVKIEKLDTTRFKPWFESREEALSVMHVSQLKQWVREAIKLSLPIEEYLNEIPWESWLSYPRSRKPTEKILFEIAYHFEQQAQPVYALSLYSFTNKAPARERRIRILEKMEKTEEAIKLAQEIITSPENATEQTFAHDYLNKSGVRINRSMTRRLKRAPKIVVSKSHQKVEKLAIEYFEKEGWTGIHAENYLWRGLFGLVFWEIIFDESFGAFHHPLQRQPSDLEDRSFFEARSISMKQLLKSIKTKKVLQHIIADTFDKKEGTANRFVHWHPSLFPSLRIMIEKLPLKGMKKVLLEIPKATKTNSTGFPDLFLWKEDDYQFYEIKSPNDHLSAQQLFWLNFLTDANIKVDVLRVNYEE